MAKKTRLFTSILALLFALFVFGSSLIMASQIRSKDSMRVSERKFYISQDILPDHVFYPFLMIADKIILETSFGERKIFVKIKLAANRLYSSKMLIESGQDELAISTITKSQKYLISATQDFFSSQDRSQELRNNLLKALEDNSENLEICRKSLDGVDTTPISDLISESNILISQLKK